MHEKSSSQPQHLPANRIFTARDENRPDHHPAVTDQRTSVNPANSNAAWAVKADLVVRELAGLVARVLPPEINLRVEVSADLWPIVGDPGEIHQALINILLNARVAMPGQGQLIISARNITVHKVPVPAIVEAHPGDYVEVAISHSGAGIYQSPLGPGVGFRLAQVARMLHRHRGFARLGSRSGELVTLSLYLPRARIARAPIMAGAEPAGPTGGSILVVDDEPAILALSRQILARAGYRVLLARDGREALTHFTRRRSEIRLVLTDLAMPGMNGFTLLWVLRRSKSDLRLIVATGQCMEEHHRELARLGVRHVLLKPFPSRQLLDTVSRTLAEPVQCEPDLFLVEPAANEPTTVNPARAVMPRAPR